MEFLMNRRSGQGPRQAQFSTAFMSLMFVSLLALLILSGISCSGSGKQVISGLEEKASPWRFARGGVAGHGAVVSGDYDGRLDVVWERGLKEKPQANLTLANGALVLAGSKRKIFLIDHVTGETITKFKNRSSPQSGGALIDSLLYNSTSPPFNYLDCRNVSSGKLRWRSVMLDISAPLLVRGKRLFALGGDGVAYCLDRFSGDLLWEKRLGGKMIAAPALEVNGEEMLLWIVNSFGWIGAFDATSGQERYRRVLGEPLVSTPVLAADGSVYVSGQGGHAFMLRPVEESRKTAFNPANSVYPADPADPDERAVSVDSFALTEYPLQSPGWTSPALADGFVVFSDNSGHVYGFRAGKLEKPLWQVSLDATLVASPIIVGKYVVVGLLDGHIYTLELSTGEIVHSRLLESSIKYPPVSDGEHVFVATQRKSLYCLGSLKR